MLEPINPWPKPDDLDNPLTKRYRVNEIFCSLQGEGAMVGQLNIFIRFAGCNLRCDIAAGERSPGGFRCDTEFVSFKEMTAGEMITFAKELNPKVGRCILTGGEPALQADAWLVEMLKHNGYQVAIETNGTMLVSHLGLDWITVSPKVAEHAIMQRAADEVKYVRGLGQGIPRTVVQANHYFISPAFDGSQLDERTLRHCMELVKENPQWRLSVQLHKFLQIR